MDFFTPSPSTTNTGPHLQPNSISQPDKIFPLTQYRLLAIYHNTPDIPDVEAFPLWQLQFNKQDICDGSIVNIEYFYLWFDLVF